MNAPGRVVVAHFSKWRSIATMLVCSAIVVADIYITFFYKHGSLIERLSSGNGRTLAPFLWLSWIGAGLTALFLLIIAKHSVLDRSVALWIETDRLIFVNRFLFSVRLNSIENVRLGPIEFNRTGLILTLKDGTVKKLPVAGFVEGADAVITRLRKFI